MLKITRDLWNDQAGFVVSAELALISTVCVLGLVVGLSAVRDSGNCELTDLSAAICSLDQSYYYSGFSSRKWPGCCTTKAWTSGSAFYKGCKTCTNFNDVDFVTTSNVAPCTTCTTTSTVVPTPVVEPEVVPVVPAPVPVIETPQPTPVPCPPAPAATAVPVESVSCPQPVSASVPVGPAPVNCAVPVNSCPPAVMAVPACGAPAPAVRPVLVPQGQQFNW